MERKVLLPPSYLLLACVMMVPLNLLLPLAVVIAVPWRPLGTIPLLVGILLILLASSALRHYNTTLIPFEVSTALVTTSVYRFSRNPIYLGMVLFLLGVAFLMGSLSPFLVVPLFIVLIV